MKYQVKIKEIEVYIVDVEADSVEQAICASYEAIDTSQDNKARYHHDSESKAEVIQHL